MTLNVTARKDQSQVATDTFGSGHPASCLTFGTAVSSTTHYECVFSCLFQN